MTMRSKVHQACMAIVILALLMPATARAARPGRGQSAKVASSSSPAGQSATLLPNGQVLLLGGEGTNGPLASAELLDPRTKQAVPLKASLNHPRAWHTATLLPDGTVLIFGGVDAVGIVTSSELFNSLTGEFQPLPQTGLLPRAHHTATLLTDGLVLFVGGTSSDGTALSALELWDSRKGSAITLPAELGTPRSNHSATLLADGRVLIRSGVNNEGVPLSDAELYDPDTQSFTPIAPGEQILASSDASALAASIPEDGAQNFPLNGLIGLRYSTLIEVETAQHDLAAAAVTIGKLRDQAPTDPEILYAAYRINTDLAGEALLSLSLAAPQSGS